MPDASFRITADTPVRGTIVADAGALAEDGDVADVDVYAFEGPAGGRAHAAVFGAEACVRIVDATGAPVAGDTYFNGKPAICGVSALNLARPGADAVVLPSDGDYFAMVRTARQAGISPYELTVHVATSTIPTAPLDVVLDPRSERIEVAWSPPASDGGAAIASYVVERQEGVFFTRFEVPADHTTFSDVGLSNGVYYCYTVRAVNVQGAGPGSVRVCAWADAVPSAPQDVRDHRHRGADIAWDAPKYAGDGPVLHYVVCWAPAPASLYTCYADEPVSPSEPGTSVAWTDTRAISDTALLNCYRVFAENVYGAGRMSGEVCLKTA